MRVERAITWLKKRPFLIFIIGAVLVSAVMTSVSMWLYKASGAANLDLSRPGYESVRNAVEDDNDTSTKPYSATGDLDESSIQDFRNRYETLKNKLDKTNNYDESDMSDENLGLSSTTSSSDSTNQ